MPIIGRLKWSDDRKNIRNNSASLPILEYPEQRHHKLVVRAKNIKAAHPPQTIIQLGPNNSEQILQQSLPDKLINRLLKEHPHERQNNKVIVNLYWEISNEPYE